MAGSLRAHPAANCQEALPGGFLLATLVASPSNLAKKLISRIMQKQLSQPPAARPSNCGLCQVITDSLSPFAAGEGAGYQ